MLNKKYVDLIESKLLEYFNGNDNKNELNKAMKYSLTLKGKRVRPLLLLEFCKACSGEVEKTLPFACAIEMIHTYSLIHDDLPCMDNDDMRRGAKSNHKVFGEDMALLAGDALLNLAFEVMLSEENVKLLGESKVIAASRTIAEAVGRKGMILGQVMDLKSENCNIPLSELEKMHLNKTAKLISASCEAGCIVAGAKENLVSSAKEYGQKLGLAFQIMDDILDVTSTQKLLGKKPGSDLNNSKSTYVSLLGLEKSRKLVRDLTALAVKALDEFKGDKENLQQLALELSNRIK